MAFRRDYHDSCAGINFEGYCFAQEFQCYIQVVGVSVPKVSRYMGLPLPSSCIVTVATADFVKYCEL